MRESQDKNLKTFCKTWKKYKGVRRPQCCGGMGCRCCWLIYEQAQCCHPMHKWSYGTSYSPSDLVEHMSCGGVLCCDMCHKRMPQPTILNLLNRIMALEEKCEELQRLECNLGDLETQVNRMEDTVDDISWKA